MSRHIRRAARSKLHASKTICNCLRPNDCFICAIETSWAKCGVGTTGLSSYILVESVADTWNCAVLHILCLPPSNQNTKLPQTFSKTLAIFIYKDKKKVRAPNNKKSNTFCYGLFAWFLVSGYFVREYVFFFVFAFEAQIRFRCAALVRFGCFFFVCGKTFDRCENKKAPVWSRVVK